MAGDDLRLSPVPHFWLVKYGRHLSYLEVSNIRSSFSLMGFGVYRHNDDLTFKISHTKPKLMSFWTLVNGDVIKPNKLDIVEYTHNVRKKKSDAVYYS